MKNRTFYLLFFLSGALGLVYQVVWTRLLILIFGSTVLGISTIVTVFLGGLAAGGYWIGKRADAHPRPLALYGWFEIVIGIYAVLVPFLFDGVTPLYAWFWNQTGENYEILSFFRFGITSILLILPTFLMGGTLPLLVSHASRHGEKIGTGMGRLYGLNTLGAVLGTLTSGFLMLPFLGVTWTILVCALANVVVGVVALALDPKKGSPPEMPETAPESKPRWTLQEGIVLGAATLSGFAALVLEVGWSRLLGTIYGSSLHGFCITLGAFLGGIALGSLYYSRRSRKKETTLATYALIEGGIGIGALLFFLLSHELIFWNFVIIPKLQEYPLLWILVRYGLTLILLIGPTFLMGMAFPAAASLLGGGRQPGDASGRLYSWNTLGSILGSFAAGFFLLPWLGLEGTLLLAVGLLFLVALFLFLAAEWKQSGNALRFRIAFAVLAVAALGLFYFRPAFEPGYFTVGRVYFDFGEQNIEDRAGFFERYAENREWKTRLFYRDGRNASVGVYTDPDGNRWLEVNGKVDASNQHTDMTTQILSGVLPMLVDADPREALVIGCGSGTTVGALTLFPQLEKIHLVELERAVVESSVYFEQINHGPMQDPRVEWLENDGRNLLLLEPKQYDLIISEPSNPWMTGAANLFTREFFELVRSRLTDRGILCQWLQLYAMHPEDLKTLVRTLLSVFPDVLVFQTNPGDLVILTSRDGPIRIHLNRVAEAFGNARVAADMEKIGIPWAPRLLEKFRLGATTARSFAGEGELNTDDNLRIESSTPYSLFEDTNVDNHLEIQKYPARIIPSLVFPDDADRAARLALEYARGFHEDLRDNFGRQFWKEFLRRIGAEGKPREDVLRLFEEGKYKGAKELADDFGYR